MLIVLFKHTGFNNQNRIDLFYLVLSGIAMGASWMFFYEAYQLIGVSIASLAYYCGAIFAKGRFGRSRGII